MSSFSFSPPFLQQWFSHTCVIRNTL
jgi:hypothetical protein